MFEAPAGWRAIDLLSDVHLSADHPRTFEAWRSALLETDADAVFMLGDLFEVWIGDDARNGAFEQQCIAVLREAGRHRRLAFMAGNRDFLVGDAMLTESGVQALDDPTLLTAFGRRLLLTHGDALCLEDEAYQRLRSVLRSPAWQQQVLARPLDERAALARQLRQVSDAKRGEAAGAGGFDPAAWADVDAPEAARWLDRASAAVMVHGHTHRPDRHDLPGGGERWVLSDWSYDEPDQPARADVLRLTAAGLLRRPGPGVVSAAASKDVRTPPPC
ncbi:UDP-2,3-diacylglucosamine diphosphatase [Aquabacterium sp. J223]|uniref:UDP-2,3-diacylglucosamine diphosphatase n=1 Tax=Aquabacterium sp. J223 TaxID=2898431 RepID=UPI0021ADCE74|nr:UDP-2,3-diacylglucosamine diphosphatase [Aquabacterium sp. J223]UUX94670.1 UDP-2,3-diacylglucosamine diphosphatase [Aquabacterium sp. J223]